MAVTTRPGSSVNGATEYGVAATFRLWEAGWQELATGLSEWRKWHLMGTSELRRRYARSRLGEFWVSLSTGASIAILGVVWALLWRMPIADMLPYIAVSQVIWLTVTGMVSEATNAFHQNSRYFLNERLSFSTVIWALIYRNLIILGHNSVIIAIVFVIFSQPVGWQALLAVPGLLLVIIASVWVSYVVATLCTRYRDLAHVVTTTLTLAFYVTPVLWKPGFLPEAQHWIILVNPFAVFLSVVRDPLLGVQVPVSHWLIASGIAFVGLTAALPFIGRYHRRIVYWL